jgi:HlyD family secretion protein
MAANKKSGWLKWLVILAVVAGGVVGAVLYLKKPKDGAVEFKTTPVARGEITQLVTANGQITPVIDVEVGSQVSGILTNVLVDFNSKVKQGDMLAQIDPSSYEFTLNQNKADLVNSEAALELAQVNAKRAAELFKSALISKSDYDTAMAALHQAEATVTTREAMVERGKVDVQRCTIYSPIDGIVISRDVQVGQTVAASFNTPKMFEIANDLGKMKIEAMVSEADVGGVEVNQPVKFMVDAFPNRQFHGLVSQVRYAPITNQNVVTYTTIVDVNNADLKLRPGMTANVSIITSQHTNVVTVPNAALRFRPPEGATIASTNDAIAKAAGTNGPTRMRGAGDMPMPPWAAERRRPTEEERKKYEDSLTPEQKEQFRQMRERMRAMRANGDGPGGAGGSGGPGAMSGGANRPNGSEGPAIRTVYLLDKQLSKPDKPVLVAVSIKTGISDGSTTEVEEGLKPGDVVVTGTITAAAVGTRTGSPFGGPFGGPRR